MGMTDTSERRRHLSLSRYLVNKEINPQHPKLPKYKGDGWTTKEIKEGSLQSILTGHGFAINGCRLGEERWEESGYQRVVRENVLDVTLVGLDFDNDTFEKTSIEDAIHDPILGTAAFGYTSSSNHKYPQDKYRLLWWLPEPLSPDDAELLLAKMLKLWPGVDPQCGNSNRIWYGHRGGDVLLRHDGAVLPIDEIVDRYDIEIGEDISHGGYGMVGAGGGSDDEYILGFHDTFCDERGLAIAALQYIPTRGKPGSSQTYSQSMATVAGLVDHFGPDLAMDIIDEADWEGEYWDIRKSQLRSITGMVVRNRKNRNPKRATFGAVLKRAKAYGMSSAEIGDYRKGYTH
jgi:hypothetical protein